MPRKARELTAVEVRRIQQPGRHAVGSPSGLHLLVKDTGARSWVLRTRIGEKRRDIGLGAYPDVTLAKAREAALETRKAIAEGVDPVAKKKAARAALIAEQAKAMTFAEAARQCHAMREKEFRNRKHAAQWLQTLDTYAIPVLGKVPVADVELAHVLKVLEPIWEKKTETATRLRQRMESVLAWATVRGYRKGDNPAAWRGNLDHVLAKPRKITKVEHHPAVPWQQVGEFMAALRKQPGMGARALEFAILTAARSGEVRNATWNEIDLAAKLWTVPGARTKSGRTHRVPLSDDAIALLESLPRMVGSRYVFAAPRGGALSDMAISGVCRRMGVEAVPHGFRSSFKDWARNRSRYPDEVSELALAHVNSDATRAAYARDELLPQRTRMMTDWAKYLREVPITADIASIGEAAHG